MKKIVSALTLSALTLGVASAADISIEYNTGASLYKETHTRGEGESSYGKTKDGKGDSTKEVLDLDGYGVAESDFIIKASNDFAGFVLDIDPNASTKSNSLDEYYGWLRYGNLQVTTGKWTGRYVNRVKEDAGSWDDADFERYKPGLVKIGKYGTDIDNLTRNIGSEYQYDNNGDVKKDDDGNPVGASQVLGTSVAYTLDAGDISVLAKGLVIESGRWGGFIKGESGNYQNEIEGGLGGELAVRMDKLFDINLAVRSLHRDELAFGLFVRPLVLEELNALIGFTFGRDFKDYGDGMDSNYYEWAVDLRARYAITDSLFVTTMNNLSVANAAKAKNGEDTNLWHIWNMVSVAYDASEQLRLQLTAQNEGYIKATQNGTDYASGDMGGFTISVIPGVVWSFNENASITAGLKLEWENVGATNAWKGENSSTRTVQIPIVFDVAL